MALFECAQNESKQSSTTAITAERAKDEPTVLNGASRTGRSGGPLSSGHHRAAIASRPIASIPEAGGIPTPLRLRNGLTYLSDLGYRVTGQGYFVRIARRGFGFALPWGISRPLLHVGGQSSTQDACCSKRDQGSANGRPSRQPFTAGRRGHPSIILRAEHTYPDLSPLISPFG